MQVRHGQSLQHPSSLPRLLPMAQQETSLCYAVSCAALLAALSNDQVVLPLQLSRGRDALTCLRLGEPLIQTSLQPRRRICSLFQLLACATVASVASLISALIPKSAFASVRRRPASAPMPHRSPAAKDTPQCHDSSCLQVVNVRLCPRQLRFFSQASESSPIGTRSASGPNLWLQRTST